MKKTNKKIIGGLMVVGLLATIGAVAVSASPEFLSDLTDEQKEYLKELRQELKDKGASCEEIRETMKTQLEEYGIEMPTREEIIDKRIEHTQQRLDILERIKVLVQENPDISNEEIREIIQGEFELEMPEDGLGKMKRRGSCRGPHFGLGSKGFMNDQKSEE